LDDFKIETEHRQNEDVRILRIIGPLALTTLFDFQDALRREAAAVTIIDLSAVPYIDSVALGSLLGLHVSCEQKGRQYALAGTIERLENIFRVTHVDNILRCFHTVRDAQKALPASVASGN